MLIKTIYNLQKSLQKNFPLKLFLLFLYWQIAFTIKLLSKAWVKIKKMSINKKSTYRPPRPIKSRKWKMKTTLLKFSDHKFIKKGFSMNNTKQDKKKYRKAFSLNMASLKAQQTTKEPISQKLKLDTKTSKLLDIINSYLKEWMLKIL